MPLSAASVSNETLLLCKWLVFVVVCDRKVPPLTEKAAIELGGDILAEFFVFGTACAAILIGEFSWP